VDRRLAGGPVVAAARGLAVDGDHVGTVRPGVAHPGGEAGLEQRRIDPVHQRGQPATAGDTVLERRVAAEEVQVGLAPGGADHRQQDLRQRMEDAACIARVVDLREMLQPNGKARFV
jgi:hypothetical protein